MTSKKKRKLKPTIVDKTIELEVALFDMGVSYKAQAVKGCEEAAEVLGAVQIWENLVEADSDLQVQAKWDILDEVSDAIQAYLNLLYILGFDEYDLNNAMCKCIDKNKERGRL